MCLTAVWSQNLLNWSLYRRKFMGKDKGGKRGRKERAGRKKRRSEKSERNAALPPVQNQGLQMMESFTRFRNHFSSFLVKLVHIFRIFHQILKIVNLSLKRIYSTAFSILSFFCVFLVILGSKEVLVKKCGKSRTNVKNHICVRF